MKPSSSTVKVFPANSTCGMTTSSFKIEFVYDWRPADVPFFRFGNLRVSSGFFSGYIARSQHEFDPLRRAPVAPGAINTPWVFR
jgi:hypothetical protein